MPNSGLPWHTAPCDETLTLVQLGLSGAGAAALKDVGIRETLGQRLPGFQRILSVLFAIINGNQWLISVIMIIILSYSRTVSGLTSPLTV